MKRKIEKSGKKVTEIRGWHPIKGKWHFIVQVIGNKKIEYYTDGKKETITIT